MKRLILNDKRLPAVYDWGQNTGKHPPLVLVHGFCEDASLWERPAPWLRNIPCLLVDLPGFGQSLRAAEARLPAYAQALADALDALSVDRCVLVGHSLGGYVALEFAAAWPKRLAGLGLFHSHPFADNEERKTARDRGIETLRAGKRDLYVAQLFPNLFAPAFAETHPEQVQEMIATGRRQSAEGIIDALQAMKEREDTQQVLERLDCPVLFIQGTEDGLIPTEQVWQTALLPAQSRVEILSGVGHMGMLEAPDRSAAVLAEFMTFCKQ